MTNKTSGVLLTIDMIKNAATPNIYNRGRSYYKDGMVLEWEEDVPGLVMGLVMGSKGQLYETNIDFGDDYFDGSCTCPYDWSGVCKHMVALALEYLDSFNGRQMEIPHIGDLDSSSNIAAGTNIVNIKKSDVIDIDTFKKNKALDSFLWKSALDDLFGQPEPQQGSSNYRVIYRINATEDCHLVCEIFKARIGKKGKGSENHYYYDQFSPSNFLRPKDKAILGLLSGDRAIYAPRYLSQEIIDFLLRLLADEEYVFLGSTDRKPHISLTPVKANLLLKEEGKDHAFEVSLQPEKLNEVRDKLYIIGEDKPWLTDGLSFFPLETKLPGSILRSFLWKPQIMPEEDIPLFMERYYDTLLDKGALEIKSDRVKDARNDISPRPVLHLEDANRSLIIKPCFAYGDGPPQVTPDTESKIVKATEGNDSFWARRKLDAEAQVYMAIEGAGVKLDNNGTGRLSGDDALDFLYNTVDQLKDKGWEIVGEVTSLRLNRAVPKVGARISSGIDWFDLNLEAGYGDSHVDISTILAAYRSGRRYVNMDDGSWGLLPLDWLQKVAAPMEELADLNGHDLNSRGEGNGKSNGKIRVRAHNIPLAEDILLGVDIQAPPSFIELQKRLRSFIGIEKTDIPEGLTAELRSYQERGLDWLDFLSKFSFNGILADDMGLGKTIQTLAHLLREKTKGVAKNPSLIIAPTSVSYNWAEESRRFTPGLNVLVLTGPDRHQRFKEISGADIVVTTYALLRRDFDQLKEHLFHYIILDEAQYIKNPMSQTARFCKKLLSGHRLALTGTPMENSLTELWSIFDFLMPGLLGSHKSFQTRYEKPIAKMKNKEQLERLKRRLKPFILRRVKQEVATELPPKTEIVAYCEMTPSQKTLYQQVLNTYRAKVLESIAKKGIERSQITILDALLKLRQVCNHPQLLKVASNKVKTSGKMELFQEMVEQLVGEGHRALVFSQFTQMLAKLKEWLDRKNIPYCYLDGRTRDRSKVIDEFNKGGMPLFLISLKAGGVGLNLTAADYVIHIDPWWNPAVENQATDRAYRIGQDKHVFVYKLITKKSIEEKILKLQERKKELFDSLLSEGNLGNSLTREDLEDLFSDVDG